MYSGLNINDFNKIILKEFAMNNKLLQINDLHVSVENKEILKGINLNINKGEVHVVMGPNGAGKSTLAFSIMNHPKYIVTKGDILFEGENINDLSSDKRAKKGIFLSFQSPAVVPGITVEKFIRASKILVNEENIGILKFKKELLQKMEELKIDSEYANRYFNQGFSGGEKKKNEILQMSILNPKLAILDETDSGLDVDAVRIVSEGVQKYKNENNAVLIITHHKEILHSIKPDVVHVIIDGKIVISSDSSLIDEIENKGYEWLKKEVNL